MGARCFLLDGTFELRGYEALGEYGEAHTRATAMLQMGPSILSPERRSKFIRKRS